MFAPGNLVLVSGPFKHYSENDAADDSITRFEGLVGIVLDDMHGYVTIHMPYAKEECLFLRTELTPLKEIA